MKTIKERAEAHAPIKTEDDWSKIKRQMLKQTSYEIGANYVLSELASVVLFSNDDSLRGNLINMVKLLKGE